VLLFAWYDPWGRKPGPHMYDSATEEFGRTDIRLVSLPAEADAKAR